MIIGFTQGTYDLFHIGHLNIFKNAKQYCDYLIVAVNTDELVGEYKNRTPVIPFEERIEIIQAIKYVDKAIPQTSLEKLQIVLDNNVNIVFIGSDWQNNERWKRHGEEFKEHGIELKFLPHTAHTSSTIIKRALAEIEEVG